MKVSELLLNNDDNIYYLPPCEHYVNTVHQLQKAVEMQISNPRNFDIIIDLEDGKGSLDEQEHLTNLLDAAVEIPVGIRFGFRILDQSKSFSKIQLQKVIKRVGQNLAYIKLPKINSYEQVAKIAKLINTYSEQYNITRLIAIQVLIETQEAVDQCDAIAAHPQVEALDFGIIDFINDHNGYIDQLAMVSPLQFQHALIHRAKTMLIAAAAKNNKVAAHNLCLNIDDYEKILADARMARLHYGFSRMICIHPSQIDPIIDAFSLSNDELERLYTILERAQQIDWKPMQYEGLFYDLASYKYFFNQLKSAFSIGEIENDKIRKWVSENI